MFIRCNSLLSVFLDPNWQFVPSCMCPCEPPYCHWYFASLSCTVYSERDVELISRSQACGQSLQLRDTSAPTILCDIYRTTADLAVLSRPIEELSACPCTVLLRMRVSLAVPVSDLAHQRVCCQFVKPMPGATFPCSNIVLVRSSAAETRGWIRVLVPAGACRGAHGYFACCLLV